MNKKLSSAQMVTKRCYNESTRNLCFKILCNDYEDFKRCIQMVGAYNEFYPEELIKALDKNLDNKKTYRYFIGRELSPVIYIEETYILPGSKFQDIMETIASESRADEVNIERDPWVVGRIWWD